MAGRKSVWKSKVLPKLDKVTEWRSKKYTYIELARALNICEKTFYKYFNEKQELRDAIELGDTHIEHEVKNKLIDLCLGGIKKEKKILITEGLDKNKKPIIKGQRIEVEETLPSLGAIKYFLDKRDGSYNNYNNNNKEVGEYDYTIKTEEQKQETLSARLRNIVEEMDRETKKGTDKC